MECEPPAGHWPRLEMNSSRHDWVELSLPCSFQAAERFAEFTEAFFYELPEDTRKDLRTALRELILNAIEWGGKLDEARRVGITIVRSRDSIFCKIADPGDGFSFHTLGHASISNAADTPWDHMPVREKLGLRAGELRPSAEIVDICLEVVDTLKKFLYRQWSDEATAQSAVSLLLARIARQACGQIENVDAGKDAPAVAAVSEVAAAPSVETRIEAEVKETVPCPRQASPLTLPRQRKRSLRWFPRSLRVCPQRGPIHPSPLRYQ